MKNTQMFFYTQNMNTRYIAHRKHNHSFKNTGKTGPLCVRVSKFGCHDMHTDEKRTDPNAV